ncbi:MAG: response regulator [Bacteroidales bacterium]|nr:response regulator [Bacteroidales bacterium]
MPSDKTVDIPEVLLIEDDADTITILNIWLSAVCHLTVTKDGESAMKILDDFRAKEKHVCLFLVDINLPPPWNGITLKTEIQQRFMEYQFTPFIAETAYAMPMDQERMKKAGFVDCVFKPLDRLSLLNTLSQYLAF